VVNPSVGARRWRTRKSVDIKLMEMQLENRRWGTKEREEKKGKEGGKLVCDGA